MKKLVLAFGLMFAMSMISCNDNAQSSDTQDNIEQDTIEAVEADSVSEVTGIAIAGAMNSVYLLVDNDTIEFRYPDLDNDHRDSWEIDDTLTVRYIKTENGDSVTDITNIG